jgi:predicted DNA binding CopG/RHH family protein
METVTKWEEVPAFACEHDESKFWQAHRLDVRLLSQSLVTADQAESTTISLRMDPRMLARVKRLARSRYLNYQSMMKQWMAERLEQELRDQRGGGR